MGFLPLAIVLWLVAVAAWFLISKYYKTSDADKIKQRLTGIGKARANKKTKNDNKDGNNKITRRRGTRRTLH